MGRIMDRCGKSLVPLMVRKMDHISCSDHTYVMGNLLEFTGSVTYHELTDQWMELHVIMIESLLNGDEENKIIHNSNEYIKEKEIDKKGVKVQKEWRITKELTEEDHHHDKHHKKE